MSKTAKLNCHKEVHKIIWKKENQNSFGVQFVSLDFTLTG